MSKGWLLIEFKVSKLKMEAAGFDEHAAAMQGGQPAGGGGQAQEQQIPAMQQNYNSESDEDQYEIDGFSDDPAMQN